MTEDILFSVRCLTVLILFFELQKAATDSSDKPETDIVIEKISIEKYDGEDVKFHMSDYK